VCDRKRSKGYGYVHFENEGCSDFEISSLDGIMWNGQVIHVCKFENKHKRTCPFHIIPSKLEISKSEQPSFSK
jgi:RNA recognition motif-containing protein